MFNRHYTHMNIICIQFLAVLIEVVFGGLTSVMACFFSVFLRKISFVCIRYHYIYSYQKSYNQQFVQLNGEKMLSIFFVTDCLFPLITNQHG